MRVLVVDDSRTMRDIVRSVLAQLDGVEIHEAASGAEGLELAAEIRPGLILVDALMPEMDGLGFVRALRGRGDETPVILMGRSNSRADVVEAIKAGASNYVAKPFTPDVLSQRVQETLGAFAPAARVAS